jgi:hypothetical protein
MIMNYGSEISPVNVIKMREGRMNIYFTMKGSPSLFHKSKLKKSNNASGWDLGLIPL